MADLLMLSTLLNQFSSSISEAGRRLRASLRQFPSDAEDLQAARRLLQQAREAIKGAKSGPDGGGASKKKTHADVAVRESVAPTCDTSADRWSRKDTRWEARHAGDRVTGTCDELMSIHIRSGIVGAELDEDPTPRVVGQFVVGPEAWQAVENDVLVRIATLDAELRALEQVVFDGATIPATTGLCKVARPPRSTSSRKRGRTPPLTMVPRDAPAPAGREVA